MKYVKLFEEFVNEQNSNLTGKVVLKKIWAWVGAQVKANVLGNLEPVQIRVDNLPDENQFKSHYKKLLVTNPKEAAKYQKKAHAHREQLQDMIGSDQRFEELMDLAYDIIEIAADRDLLDLKRVAYKSLCEEYGKFCKEADQFDAPHKQRKDQAADINRRMEAIANGIVAEAMEVTPESDVVVDDYLTDNGDEIKAAEIVGAIVSSKSEKEYTEYFYDSYGITAFTENDMQTLIKYYNEYLEEVTAKETEEEEAKKKEENAEEDPLAGI